MTIKKRDYYYEVVKNDSLRKIAEKHGMPGCLGRELIWEDEKNHDLHITGVISDGTSGEPGKERRQIYLNGEYFEYNHTEHKNKGVVILYVHEKVWIPSEPSIAEEKKENQQRNSEKEFITREISSYELLNGISIKPNSEYELIFPVFTLRVEGDPEDQIFQDTKFTLKSEENDYYNKSLTGKDGLVIEDIIELRFVGAHQDLKYTLTVEPGKDENGNKDDNYIVFKNSKLSDV